MKLGHPFDLSGFKDLDKDSAINYDSYTGLNLPKRFTIFIHIDFTIYYTINYTIDYTIDNTLGYTV